MEGTLRLRLEIRWIIHLMAAVVGHMEDTAQSGYMTISTSTKLHLAARPTFLILSSSYISIVFDDCSCSLSALGGVHHIPLFDRPPRRDIHLSLFHYLRK
jgi:hypothetical protein